MSKCRNELFLGKVRVNKLTKETEVTFNVLEDLPECRKINAKRHYNTLSGASYNRFEVPQNVFECEAPACGNTGTLYPGAAVVYQVHGDATEWASGVITFYVKDATGVTVLVSDTSSFTNADSYTITPGTAGADGYAPIVVDLSQAGTAVGSGYTASADGGFIKITLTGATAGISSIGIYDSMDDLKRALEE